MKFNGYDTRAYAAWSKLQHKDEEILRLRGRAAEVIALHQPDGRDGCRQCGWNSPCKTVRILMGES
jgi:hypothetical protein